MLAVLRRHAEERGEPVPDRLPLAFPVSARTEQDTRGRNRFAVARFAAPLAEPDLAKRIAEIHDFVHTVREEPGLEFLEVLAPAMSVTGVRSLRRGAGKPGAQLFAGAWLCGIGFGVSKYVEYGEKMAVGITPTTNNFFMYYYILTGLHMFHVLIGLTALTYMFVQALKPRITISTLRYVEGCGCFWHLVDLLWVVLFPLLYLVRI